MEIEVRSKNSGDSNGGPGSAMGSWLAAQLCA